MPSVQMGPLRLFVEVISLLQPNLNTELLPELARLLLQQTTAPTLQVRSAVSHTLILHA